MIRWLLLVALALCGCEKARDVAPAPTEDDRPPGPGPEDPPATGTIELTSHDITRVRDLGSRTISVLGVPLGADRDEAERIITGDPRVTIHPDRANPERFYVDLAGTGTSVFYFIWDPAGPPGLNRVTVFVDAADLLVGRTRALLTLEALDPDSDVRRAFLGTPASDRVSLDIPSIGLQHVTYAYPELGIEVVDQQDRGLDSRKVVFALVRGLR